ncbi:TPA: serine--tRNA ligase [Candidatus Woesearchaeota archaeon]|nr:serine--tRNA ligase [Candidatus Woesearchaeota archaeon]
MIDIKLIRENPELVKENIKKKFQNHKLKMVDEVLEFDRQIKELKTSAEQLRHRRNVISEEINKLKKEKKDIKALLEEAKGIPEKINHLEDIQESIEEKLKSNMMQIPNIIHGSVPLGKDSTENVEIERLGHYKIQDFEVKNHAELAESLDIADFESSAKTSGTGFFYMKGDLALLNQSMIRYGIDFMAGKGYTLVEPPLMIKKEICDGVVDFEFFKNMAYKIDGEDLYLIATSEHPLIGMFINKTVKEEDLPIKLVGFSQCFRKEIGSHGIDEKGFFRTHQFNKVEMAVICKPEDSYKYYDEMIDNVKGIFTGLELPIRVLEICSGDLADLKSKSADLEAWSPRKKEYFEVASCSNLTDAQARRLNIKYQTKSGEKFLCHTLNNTAIATSRAIVAILENHQNADGSINIPKALQHYMNGKKRIEKK